MKLTGEYVFDPTYNNEILISSLLSGLVVITIFGLLFYYFITFKGKKMHFHFAEMSVNILLSSGLISGFLCLFYFTYLYKIEKDVLCRNIKRVFKDLLPEDKINPEYIEIIKNLIEYVKKSYIDKSENEDSVDIAQNNSVRNKAIIIYAGGFAVIIIISIILIIYYKLPMLEIFGINLILLIGLAISDFMFETFFAKNYNYIDINNILYDSLAVYQKQNPYLSSKVDPALPPSGKYFNPFFIN